MKLSAGLVIAGRYRLHQKIGEGGMGEVWGGTHVHTGVRVAIKTLLAAGAVDKEILARFRREANLLGRIASDYVSRVVDFLEDPQVGLVLVMEYVEGEALSSVVKKRKLSVEEAVDLGMDVMRALTDLHRVNVIHRDLKPGNLIMRPMPNGRFRAVLVDFGMGRITKGSEGEEEVTQLTRADMALGTLEYMAPEQILNSREVTPASDLYAVGAMLFRAVAGVHIYGDARDAELARGKLLNDAGPLDTGRTDALAQGFSAIVGKMVQRKLENRYRTADEIIADLTALRERSQPRAPQAPISGPHSGPQSGPYSPHPPQPSYPGVPSTPHPPPSGPHSAPRPTPVVAQAAPPGPPPRGLTVPVVTAPPAPAPSNPDWQQQAQPTSTSNSTSSAQPVALSAAPARQGMSYAGAVFLATIGLVIGVASGGIGGVQYMKKKHANALALAAASAPQCPTVSAAVVAEPPPAPPPPPAPTVSASASSSGKPPAASATGWVYRPLSAAALPPSSPAAPPSAARAPSAAAAPPPSPAAPKPASSVAAPKPASSAAAP